VPAYGPSFSHKGREGRKGSGRRNSQRFTSFPKVSQGFPTLLKKMREPHGQHEAGDTTQPRSRGPGVGRTKPKCDAVRARNGRPGFAKYPYLQGNATFQPVLRRRAGYRGKLQNEAICLCQSFGAKGPSSLDYDATGQPDGQRPRQPGGTDLRTRTGARRTLPRFRGGCEIVISHYFAHVPMPPTS